MESADSRPQLDLNGATPSSTGEGRSPQPFTCNCVFKVVQGQAGAPSTCSYSAKAATAWQEGEEGNPSPATIVSRWYKVKLVHPSPVELGVAATALTQSMQGGEEGQRRAQPAILHPRFCMARLWHPVIEPTSSTPGLVHSFNEGGFSPA